MSQESGHEKSRSIHLNNDLGRRQLREVLGSLLTGLILAPERLWLVSPWVSDFDLLDNRAGDWSVLQPSWGLRFVRFSELLIECVEAGCSLSLVTKPETSNDPFLSRMRQGITTQDRYRSVVSANVHIKGLLADSWYLSGSMNFTFSGANLNEEEVLLRCEPAAVADTRFEFERCYGAIPS